MTGNHFLSSSSPTDQVPSSQETGGQAPGEGMNWPVREQHGFSQDAIAEFQRSLGWIGVLTTAVVGIHSYSTPFSRQDLQGQEVLWWLLCLVLYAALLLVPTLHPALQTRRALLWLAALESLLALGANAMMNSNNMLAALLLIVAAQVGALLPLWWAVVWLLAQSVALSTIMLINWDAADAWAFGTGYTFYQFFSLLVARVAVREIRGRQKLALVVDELRATRALLGDAARQAERLVISRELHDVLGHHLTALCMNLEVARHHAQGQAAQPAIERSSELARALLDDVRTTVHRIRDHASVDFQEEVRTLVAPCMLDVRVSFTPTDLQVLCPVQAQALLRTVQEILTNSQRHARARTVTLEFKEVGSQVQLLAFDDGHSPEKLRLGCGLSGMRERLESLGGNLELGRHAGGGLTLRATLPRWGKQHD